MKITTEYLDKNKISYTITADGLVVIDGDLDLRGTKITSLENIESIGGYLYVSQGGTIEAPALTSIGGSLDVYEGGTIEAPALTSIGGYLYVSQGGTIEAPALTSIGGSLYVRQGGTIEAPALTSIGGYLYVRQGGTIEAPALTSIGGSLYVYEGGTIEAPALTSIGEVLLNGELFGHKIQVIDGIGCVILSQKEKDGVSIKCCRRSAFKEGKFVGDRFYVASKDGNHAHGETIKLATEELAFKTGNRDLSQFRGITLDTKKTPEEWAFVYRMVTGACQYGTRRFMASKKLKKQYTLAEIIKETNGAFGSKLFNDFFERAA